jgi:hypothetical protein
LGEADTEEEAESFAHDVPLTRESIAVLKRAINMSSLDEDNDALEGSEILDIRTLNISDT